MLFPPGLSTYSFTYDNWGANPSSTPGTAITPGASNAEGSWTEIASSANISADCDWISLYISGAASSTNARNQLFDIGIDPAGGTSYTAVISNIVCGSSAAMPGGRILDFPFHIPAGSSVAVRVQGSTATAGTVRVAAKFFGMPSNPEASPRGFFSETIGTITNSNGVSFTPGTTTDGSWVSLGTTTMPLWWWQVCSQVDNGVMSLHMTYIDLAWGDTTNKIIINRACLYMTTAEAITDIFRIPQFANCYSPVPAGAEIFVRGRCSNAPVTGYNAVAVGIGG